MFQSFYNDFYTFDIEISYWQPTLFSFPKISAHDYNKLQDDLNVTEIKQVGFQMTPWKAPGSDGFHAWFFHKSWTAISKSLCSDIIVMWDNPTNIREGNQTKICLIPKVNNQTGVPQFRLKSLYNTIYKVLSKIIVNKLKVLMDDIVCPYQTGFILGRNVQENIVVSQESCTI